MEERNITTINELSKITGVSRIRLYKIMEKDDISLNERTIEKLNRTLNLHLEGVREDNCSIGYKLFKLRSENNFTCEELSSIANVGVDTVYKLEKNKYKPSKATIRKLAKAFNMEEVELRKMLLLEE